MQQQAKFGFHIALGAFAFFQVVLSSIGVFAENPVARVNSAQFLCAICWIQVAVVFMVLMFYFRNYITERQAQPFTPVNLES